MNQEGLRRTQSVSLILLLLAGCADPEAPTGDNSVRSLVTVDGSPIPTAPPFDPDNQTLHAIADLAVLTSIAGVDEPAILAEIEAIRIRFAQPLLTVATLAFLEEYIAQGGEPLEIEYRGLGTIDEAPVELAEDSHELTGSGYYELPAKYSDGASWITAFSGETHAQYEIRIPATLSELVGQASRDSGLLEGAYTTDEFDEDELATPRSITGISDTRLMKGYLNTKVGGARSKKVTRLSQNGGGTGGCFGRHHVVTSAHTLTDLPSGVGGMTWTPPVVRPGRSGTDWWSSADANTGWSWLYVPSEYISAANQGSSPLEYDMGIVVFPNRHVCSPVGWFGIQQSNTSHDDMYNAGYPGCSSSQAPNNCLSSHMYMDWNDCSTGDYSSSTDAWGYRLAGYHSCDTSPGHSGSPLFRNWSGSWVIRGVHKGTSNPNGDNTSNNSFNNGFTLFTKARTNDAAWFISAYP